MATDAVIRAQHGRGDGKPERVCDVRMHNRQRPLQYRKVGSPDQDNKKQERVGGPKGRGELGRQKTMGVAERGFFSVVRFAPSYGPQGADGVISINTASYTALPRI